MLPFPGILVPLSCFFATRRADGQNYTLGQKNSLLRWFWRAVFSRRFSSDVNERQAADIAEMNKLRDNPNYSIKLPRAEVKVDFEKGNFAVGSANSKSLILLLSSREPHSFLSGAKIDAGKVLKQGSRHEFHHIFPQAYLDKQGVDRRQINVLANICFLTRSDNNSIKDKPPSSYLEQINGVQRSQYLHEALCPIDLEKLEYDDFVHKRAVMLDAAAHDLMEL